MNKKMKNRDGAATSAGIIFASFFPMVVALLQQNVVAIVVSAFLFIYGWVSILRHSKTVEDNNDDAS